MAQIKPTVPEVVPLVKAIYAKPLGGVGCCLHIVTDDGNYENGCVDYCIAWAAERGHEDCLHVAKLLRMMSKTQRKKVSILGTRQ